MAETSRVFLRNLTQRRKDVKKFLSLHLCAFALLSACQTSKSCELVHLNPESHEYNSARLTFPVRDTVHGMGVNMVLTDGCITTYLEVHALEVLPHLANPKQALIQMRIDGKKYQGIGHLRDGNQRVMLPSDLNDLLITALKNQKNVTLKLDGYTTTLDSKDFPEQFEQLSVPTLKNRFQLPFKVI